MQAVYTYPISEGFTACPFPEPPKVYYDRAEKCLACPYPRHGLFCWSKDGENCLRTNMQTIEARHKALYKILCFDTALDTEKFCKEKSAVFLVMPEEDNTRHFFVSLLVQQIYREMLSVADEQGGRLKNRIMLYLDEYGTLPKIDSAEMIFSASRSRHVSMVPIIQSFAQLDRNYGKEGSEIITDNCQLLLFGSFAPNSHSAEVLSKSLGTRTVSTGSVSKGKNDSGRSLQRMERAQC